jgi:hypothetical protein
MATLQECIDRWHAAHPTFPLLPGEAGSGTISIEGTAAPVERCAQTPLPVEPVPTRGGRTMRSRVKQAASRLGINDSTYWRHLSRGERWCSGHTTWHPAGAFYARSGYHRDTLCKAWRRANERARYARRQAA